MLKGLLIFGTGIIHRYNQPDNCTLRSTAKYSLKIGLWVFRSIDSSWITGPAPGFPCSWITWPAPGFPCSWITWPAPGSPGQLFDHNAPGSPCSWIALLLDLPAPGSPCSWCLHGPFWEHSMKNKIHYVCMFVKSSTIETNRYIWKYIMRHIDPYINKTHTIIYAYTYT